MILDVELCRKTQLSNWNLTRQLINSVEKFFNLDDFENVSLDIANVDAYEVMSSKLEQSDLITRWSNASSYERKHLNVRKTFLW